MWVECAPVAYPLNSADGTPSVAAADGAEPMANIVKELAKTDVIVSVLRNTMNPFREPDDSLREGYRASKLLSALTLAIALVTIPPVARDSIAAGRT
jgi:hypothetical protein